MDRTHEVLILRNSFVFRLNVFLNQSRDKRVASDFDLGFGDRTVSKSPIFDIAQVRALQPDIIISWNGI